MKFSVLSLFPEMFPGPLGMSLLGKALEEEKWHLDVVNIRDFANGVHKAVDETPYGGGAGMVMLPEVLAKAIEYANPQPDRWIYLSPRGKLFTQPVSQELIQDAHIGLICGRYEGVDQRVLDYYAIEEVSLGDFVLSGGEIAAYAIIDTCIRQQFSVLGNAQTLDEESFGGGSYRNLLEYPHYTKPASWQGLEVPEVLRSGDHKKIAQWRLRQAERLTEARRPDVWIRYKQAKQDT